MELLDLLGPYSTTAESVSALEHHIGCAVYVLGNVGVNGVFVPERVGRTEADITVHLERYGSRYDTFMYTRCDSADAAFAAECELFHSLQPRDNTVHPFKPDSMLALCPVCSRGKRKAVRVQAM